MTFWNYVDSLKNWDKKRVEEHKFPVLKTIGYIYWIGLLVSLVYVVCNGCYSIGYLHGQSALQEQQYAAEKAKRALEQQRELARLVEEAKRYKIDLESRK